MNFYTEWSAELVAALAIPFPANEILQRKQGGATLSYVDSATVIRRLNALVGPHGWSAQYRITEGWGKAGMECALTILGHTQHAFGEADKEGEPIKSAESDALKRAARLFGVGLHLWDKSKPAPQPQRQPDPPADPALMAARDAYRKAKAAVQAAGLPIPGAMLASRDDSAAEVASKAKRIAGLLPPAELAAGAK